MSVDSRENFELWLFEMDDALERFVALVPTELNVKLDFSLDSLDAIESWLVERFSSHQELLSAANKALHDGLARYIGETFRRSLRDVKWSIRFDDEKFAFFGLPILIDGQSNTVVCPHTLTTTAIARRSGTFLSALLTRNIKKDETQAAQ